MAALRQPETGCPWDVEQSFDSIVPYTIEETYEVVDAIERRDAVDLCEELGDLLLQVVYHSQLAAEAGLFTFAYGPRAAGDTLEVKSDLQINPSLVGRAAGEIVVLDGATPVLRLPLSIRVLP